MGRLAVGVGVLVLAAWPASAQDGLVPPPSFTPSDRQALAQNQEPLGKRLQRIQRGLSSLIPRDRALAAASLEQTVVGLGQAERLPTIPPNLIDVLARALAMREPAVLDPARRSAQLLLAACQDQRGASVGECAATLGLSHALDTITSPGTAIRPFPVNRGPGLDKHMATAIAINWDRMSQYAELAAAKADGALDALAARKDAYAVSLYMLTSEWSTRGFLIYLDWQASALNAAGVPILAEDVIPLRPRDIRTPPRYRGVASEALQGQVSALLARFREQTARALEARDFNAVVTHARNTLQGIIALEEQGQCHFAMTRHMVASVGYGALRVEQHYHAGRKDQQLEISELGASYLEGNTMEMVHGFAVRLDRWAQDVHARGVGIVVNEFPGGHFLRALEPR